MSANDAAALVAARKFAAEVIAPNAERWETLGRVPYDIIEQAGNACLCGLLVPQDLGGLGLSIQGTMAVVETLAAACMSSSFSLVVHNNLVAHIARYGSPHLIETYLEEMISGRRVGAFLLTEPDVGSDVQAITTRAEQVDGGWIITGEKAWVSNAVFADVLAVYAQTDPSAGAKGIASFLLDADTPGVTREDRYNLMRGHALGTGGFSFDACKVGDDRLLLGPGAAFKGAMSGINLARVIVAAMCCGMLRESLAQAVSYADSRTAFGQPTLAFQGLQWMLADVATDLEAATLLTAQAVALLEAGSPVAVAAAHAKKFASRVAFSGISDCMQAMGAAGYSSDYPLARHLAAAKMAQFVDGTSEIQNVAISRALRSEYGPSKLLE